MPDKDDSHIDSGPLDLWDTLLEANYLDTGASLGTCSPLPVLEDGS